jgi:hypothetical protein
LSGSEPRHGHWPRGTKSRRRTQDDDKSGEEMLKQCQGYGLSGARMPTMKGGVRLTGIQQRTERIPLIVRAKMKLVAGSRKAGSLFKRPLVIALRWLAWRVHFSQVFCSLPPPACRATWHHPSQHKDLKHLAQFLNRSVGLR